MRKYLAILAVILAVAQAPVPVPGQTADHPASNGGAIQQQSGKGKTPSQPAPSLANQNQSIPAKGNTGEHDTEDDANAVAVSKLPSVSITKDWADWSYWGFGGILAIVSGLQVWLLYGTLRAIQTQAAHMAGQLEEMKKAREIEDKTLILQYRPKIIVRFASASDFNLVDLGNRANAKVSFSIINAGGSPAHITGGDIALWWINVPPSPQSLKVDIHKGIESQIRAGTIQPGQKYRWEETLDMNAINDIPWANYHEGFDTEDHRQLLLVGTISYVDDLGIPRTTGIHRNYDPKTRAFKPASNEGEYDD